MPNDGAVWCYGAPHVEVVDYDVGVFQTEDDIMPNDGAVWCYGAPHVEVVDYDVGVFQTFRQKTIEPDDGAVWCYGAPRVDVDNNDVDVFQTFRRRTIEYLVMVLFGVMVLHVWRLMIMTLVYFRRSGRGR